MPSQSDDQPQPLSFRHPAISLFQSALHSVLGDRASPSDPGQPGQSGLAATASHPAMLSTVEAALSFTRRELPSPGAVEDVAESCAKLYLRAAIARFTGDTAAAARLQNQIRFSTCDPLWAEVFAKYEDFLESGAADQYIRARAPGDFVLTTLPDKATILLLADWGTGTAEAAALLEQAATFRPDAVIHLGDIYYAGTPDEMQSHFQDVCAGVFGGKRPPIFTLSGNHDRYSGGAGYNGLIAQLNQPASYFCLRNAHWQFLAMDTGYHDHDPFTVVTNVTYLEQSEAAWHLDKIETAGGRGTVLLSHHQLFSFRGIGDDESLRPLALNPRLHATFSPVFDKVDWWIWGHEHNLCLFEPYAGLARGRCIGSGAVPVLVADDPYTPLPDLVLPPNEKGPPQILPATRGGNNGISHNHAYAIMTLDGPTATIRYYDVDSADLVPGKVPAPAEPIFSETVTRPVR